VVKELQRAIEHLIYLKKDRPTTIRTLRPLEIVGDRLKTYCLTRKAPMVFVIDNILAVEQVVSGCAV
jgi:hypothetical protein